MLTYSTPGVIKVEPRSHDPQHEGSTQLENNNFDRYRQLVNLDNKRHGMTVSQHRRFTKCYFDDKSQWFGH